jgi:leukotriene-A4 hydrolase
MASPPSPAVVPREKSSLSNYEVARSEHIALALTVDFAARAVAGTATHTVRVLADGAAEVVFDTKDLDIRGVLVNGEGSLFRRR